MLFRSNEVSNNPYCAVYCKEDYASIKFSGIKTVNSKVTLNLENGKRFVLSAQRRKADDYLIQSTTLNGNPWSDYRISHQQILQGGELHFEMKAMK